MNSSEIRTQKDGTETTRPSGSAGTSGNSPVGSTPTGRTPPRSLPRISDPAAAPAGTSSVAPRDVSTPPARRTEVAPSDDITDAHRDSQNLETAARATDADGEYIRHMLEVCKKHQEKLQVKLNNALENPDGTCLEKLFTANDELVAALKAGNEALKKERKMKEKHNFLDGPTIELLVQNEDVFSLICMLRAPTEKRLYAALALMRFAKNNDALRNEIRSSGGMHSFLTLYRGRSTDRDLRVVASLAVAYVLPSFVAKSQVTSPITMKLLECLRFLVTAPPTSFHDVNISRQQMYCAASTGVNALWTNIIRPLIALEKSKEDTRVDTMPALEKQVSGFRRFRARTGGGVFDQEQELKEVEDMTELAVTLITQIAKAANQEDVQTAYDIVEHVCAEDMARPIAVREGLLTTLVQWIRSEDLSKMRPSASALRYLISIEDKYNAGWIHSQVVNEGAVSEIVKLLNESVGNEVREAIAEMISALCQAPPTRAAVVESNCVLYLISLLYEQSNPASENMVHYAASALLQLAGASITQAGSSTLSKRGSSVMDKQDMFLK